jgi:predicted porin
MGVSYLADGPWEDSDTGNALDHRRQIYGADLALKFTERYKFRVETARSETPELSDSLESDATVIDVDTNPIDPLRIYGRYWRVERDFLTFGNLNLQSDNVVDQIDLDQPFAFKSALLEFDLDPNISVNHGTNEESYGLSAAYDINSYHTVSAGFRETKNDIPDEEDPQLTTRSLFAAYKRIHPEKTDWLLGVEKIDNENDDTPRTVDTSTSRILGAIKHPVGTFRYVGDTYLQFAYQFEDFADHLTSDNDTQIHDTLGRIEFHPVQEVVVYGEQGEQFIYEKIENDYTRRTDTSMAGVQGKFNRYADVDISTKYRRENDLVDNRTAEKEQTYAIHWTSLPLNVLKTRIKYEYRKTDDKTASRVQTRHIYGGEVFWDIFANLLATVKYEYEKNETKIPAEPGENTTYDDLTLRLDYKFRRSLTLFGAYRLENEELKAPPLDTTETKTTTWVLGTKYQINDRWDALSGYKYKSIDEAVKDDRQKFFAEVGYQVSRFLKVAVGYEYIDFTDDDTGEAFESHVGYVSLIGKI